MKQSRLSSFAETCLSIAIGFVVSLAITAVVLPAYGHAVTFSQNLQITAIFTVASVARGYLVRRAFNRWGRHG
jgi:membrane protein implicated in regulation of membrane protease activity